MSKHPRARRRKENLFSSTSQLKLFPSYILIDQCVSFGKTDLSEVLRSFGLEVVHVADVGMANVSDAILAKHARAFEAVTVTSDFDFLKHAAQDGTGELPRNIVWLPQVKRDSITLGTIRQTAEVIRDIAYSAPSDEAVKFVYLDPITGEKSEDVLEVPEYLGPIISLLEVRGKEGVDIKDLQSVWACSERTARKRANKLAKAKWLEKRRKSRRICYYKREKLKQLQRSPVNLKPVSYTHLTLPTKA